MVNQLIKSSSQEVNDDPSLGENQDFLENEANDEVTMRQAKSELQTAHAELLQRTNEILMD